MHFNPSKFSAINIKNSIINQHNLSYYQMNVSTILALGFTKRIQYFGVNLNDQIVFDKKQFLQQFEKDFRNLVKYISTLKRGNHKLNISTLEK